MPKFGDLGSKFLKTNVKFEINTFEIWYMRNFVKIKELILFGPKCPKAFGLKAFKKSQTFGIWAQNFQRQMINFKINTFKIEYMRNFAKIRKLKLFGPKNPNLGIWTRSLKIKS